MTDNNQEKANPDRRHFIQQGLILGASVGLTVFSSCNHLKKDEDEDKKVSPPEDLMQEHGLLNRILLIYDNCKSHLLAGASFPIETLTASAGIIRSFVEDYHEKQEENYLFPRFQKANRMIDLVQVLLIQHNAGRRMTDQILHLSGIKNPSEFEHHQLINTLDNFNNMYRPHEAREDTVLFPEFRKIVSQNEYDSLGEEFENNEQKNFGKDGFESMVAKVADIEKTLGIYELSQFTPKE
ncbi:MAG: hemerythrin domain-containing protein [Flavisolibacter sp.]